MYVGERAREREREKRCIQNMVGTPEGKRPLGRARCRWEDIIKMDFK